MSRLRTASASVSRILLVVVLTALGGCAYLNGVYNARRADRAGERALIDGNDTAAARNFALAAAAAETVLVRHPDSRWSAEALYLAGRGLAFSGSCGPALARLESYRVRGGHAAQGERAALAGGACLTAQGRHSEALNVLAPLLASRDEAVGVPAARLSARAYLALGNDADAAAMLARVDPGAADWLLARDAVEHNRTQRAESLLVRRIAAADLRADFPTLLHELWLAGDSAAALRLARAAGQSRGPTDVRVAGRMVVGELLLSVGRSDEAVELIVPVARLASDSAVVSRAREALLLASLASARTTDDLAETMRRARPPMERGRLADALLLARILARQDPDGGGGRFLAAEVARDSLRAFGVARALFAAVPRTSALAPKAWLAAAAIAGDSAQWYAAEARSRWPESPYVLALDGRDASDSLAIAAPEKLLRDVWERAVVSYADSANARRVPAAGAPRPEARR